MFKSPLLVKNAWEQRMFLKSSSSEKYMGTKDVIKSSSNEKCTGTKDVYNHGKKGLDIKNTPGYIEYADK